MPWRQVPAERVSTEPPPLTAAWALATVPLLLFLRGNEVPGGWSGWLLAWAIPLGVMAAVVLAAGRRQPALGVSLAGLVVGVSWWMLPSGGAQIGLVLALGALVWGVGLGVIPLVPGRLGPGRRALVVPAAAAADVLLVLRTDLRVPAVLLLVAVAVGVGVAAAPRSADHLVALVPGFSGRERATRSLRAIVDRIAAVVGRVVAILAMVPAAVVVVVVWVVHRMVGHDPLRSPAGKGTGWVVRLGADEHPERYHGTVRVVDRRGPVARLSGLAAATVVLALVAGGVVVLSDRGPESPTPTSPPTVAAPDQDGPGRAADECGPVPDDPVLGEQEDYAVMSCERNQAFSRGTYLAPSGYRMSDFDGETINVRDGVRRTWTPPPCDCERLRVWWFGGSAAWGEGQRDHHTLPSLLAREAWQEGLALDIENRAMPTWTFGQEVHLFAHLLSQEPAPDLVIFYTGGNDMVFQGLRLLEGRGEDSADIVLHERLFADLLRDGIPVRPEEVDWRPDPASLEMTLTAEAARGLAPAVTERLGRNAELARLLGQATTTPVEIVLQPLLAGSGDAAGPTGMIDPELLSSFTELVETTRNMLPDGIVDLSGVYADVGEPVFYDLFHTGERGAQLMAVALLEQLLPSLEASIRSNG